MSISSSATSLRLEALPVLPNRETHPVSLATRVFILFLILSHLVKHVNL